MSTHPSSPDAVVVDISERLEASGMAAEEAGFRRLLERHGSPLLVLDAACLRRRYRELRAALPGVDLFFAVKALPDSSALRILTDEGAGLDLASATEVRMAAAEGIAPGRTIHTHPVKKEAEIRAAVDFGLTTFVADNAAELEKFVPWRDRVSLLLRLRFQAPDAKVDLSRKFGCEPGHALELMRRARDRGIRISGVSFHVGSQCASGDSHAEAVAAALDLIARARRDHLAPLSVLDIGGGFPASYQAMAPDIGAFCAPIRAALARVPADLKVIAEPGRFLVADAVCAVASVVGVAERDGRPWYYLDDGVYGSYSGKLFDHAEYPLDVFRAGSRRSSVLAGPTCDSIDIVAADIALPELAIGDLVVGRSMGAYTAASATDFNGLPRARVAVVGDDAASVCAGAASG